MRTLTVIVWLVTGWWIVLRCFRRITTLRPNSRPEANYLEAG
jgi:hypothetical protein